MSTDVAAPVLAAMRRAGSTVMLSQDEVVLAAAPIEARVTERDAELWFGATLDGFGPAAGLVLRGLPDRSWNGNPLERVFPASDTAMTALMSDG